MSGAVFAYSRMGMETARRIQAALPEITRAFAPQRLAEGDFAPIPSPSASFYGELFSSEQVLVFVGSCGIAVRQIAPWVGSKDQDPAVLVVDELGTFVISLLSGHIGGANNLCRMLARQLGAVAVVTTATDLHGRFSVDAWAVQNGCAICGLQEAKAVSAAILEGDVPLTCAFPICSKLPNGVRLGADGPVGILISCRRETPFGCTLRLVPKVLTLGIGCRRGTSAQEIRQAVEAALERENLDIQAVARIASVDLKAQEPGLLAFCRELGAEPVFYTAQELMAVPGTFPPSEFVRRVTGADNVCQRAALAAGGQLIVEKTCHGPVTVAVAQMPWEVDFG